ncbi:hypothetical protein G8S49_05900 [Clostridium botulinum C]|uniref:Uncharacterized protein n=2 Tax=Clostridium botulinum TaxID=1491 RepID=A0A6G4D9H1_CLOBO|nr:hypothetical protein [Clostridium botulinum]YP_398553.1 hypothetical protein CST123 [Clostridium phage c-st]MCD3194833.1 hypothetical protein [Clostridium botulinum C]MCD3200232.1 hypothetical protein [Clostridium botulinum C]MCD3205701.1 hypothetical protein [Clostridium botulinum C]MCD3207464.1 hypothetical protein [Clostridium botulinum C]MCD3226198.1 hypothetical protein [Clostridium botulinum C]
MTRIKDLETIDIKEIEENDNLFDQLNINNSNRRSLNVIGQADRVKSNGVDMLLNFIASSFPNEQKTNSRLKITLSIILSVILIELVASTILIVWNIGKGTFKYDEWTIRLFITGIFAEIVGIVRIIVNSLFPKEDRKLYLEFIDKCVHDNQKENNNINHA